MKQQDYLKSEKGLLQQKLAREKALISLSQQKLIKIQKYQLSPNKCTCCNQNLSYDKRNNKFCSRSCSAKISNQTRIITNCHKNKTTWSLKEYHKSKEPKALKTRSCKECGNIFTLTNNKSTSKFCSRDCIIKTKKKRIQELISQGKFIGWASRSKPSYAELFFMKVLDTNNIKYIFEKKVGIYFIDFAVANIALEIDGSQHLWPERKSSDNKKDEFLTKNGYKVYRISWNQINTPIGKNQMQEKIDKFLLFYRLNKE